ncbi:MAG: phospholipid-binding protein MlaC [Acidobacteriota bacterium]
MRRRTLLLIAPALGVGLALPRGAAAVPAQSAEAFITALANDALKTLSEKLSEAEIEKRFRALLERNFDLARIGRFVLGRYWNSASDGEKQEFQKLFEDYVVRSYSLRFSEYSGETVKVTGSRAQSQENTIVASQILQPDGSPPVKLDWIVAKTGNDYLIIDVSVSGVSMSMTHRQEFAAVIEKTGGGVTALNKALQEKLNRATAAQK